VAADSSGELIEHLFREQYGRMVAGLTRVFGPQQLDLVEDIVAEAMLRALKTWPFEGTPDDPRAWLVRVARNLGLDALRRRATAARKLDELRRWEAAAPAAGEQEIADDTLRMMFTCCHPALAAHEQVALTLKTLCGFGVSEIAAALLAKEATIAQRLSRAKARLQRERVAFDVPAGEELGERLTAVLDVLYLLFNEGYRAHRGDEVVRGELVHEAIRLGAELLKLPATAQPRVHALLALMYLLGARLPARLGGGGEILTLAEQDRSLWDRRWLAAGAEHFRRAMQGAAVTALHTEAAIAACHAAAPRYADTDWSAILARYDELLALAPSPIVRLNRAVALAKVRGVAAGLAEVEALGDEPALRAYALLPATRALLEWHVGRRAAAAASFAAALALGCTQPERALLERRLRECEAGAAAPAF
jgi:RNA polymerase sigma-70 factor (ECF subfamily)